MSEEEIEAEIAWVASALPEECIDRFMKLEETLRRERDTYRSLLECANKKIERFRDIASCYFPTKNDPSDEDSES